MKFSNYADNLKWIEAAEDNNLVVGSYARILYTDDEADVPSVLSTRRFGAGDCRAHHLRS